MRTPYWPEFIDEIQTVLTGHNIYLVGGPVRDALRGTPLHDIDLTTPEDGLRLARLLADQTDGDYYPVDKERGTGRAIVSRHDKTWVIDIATFRGDTLEADLRGRDFTINAMAVPLDNLTTIIDPLDGYGDLFERKRLVMCSRESISSDPIRILRAIRHAVAFQLQFSPEVRQAVHTQLSALFDGDGLNQPERARDELWKTLSGAAPIKALKLYQHLGLSPLAGLTAGPGFFIDEAAIRCAEALNRLLTIISPRRTDNSASQMMMGVAVMVLDRHRKALQDWLGTILTSDRTAIPLLYLAALHNHRWIVDEKQWIELYRISREEARLLSQVQRARNLFAQIEEPGPLTSHRYFREVSSGGIGGLLLSLADVLVNAAPPISPEDWGTLLDTRVSPLLQHYFEEHESIVQPKPLLDGSEIMAMTGSKAGPHIGSLLTRLIEAQVMGLVGDDKEAHNYIMGLTQGND